MISLPKISGPFEVGDIVRVDKPGNFRHNRTGIVVATTEMSSFCDVQTGPGTFFSVHKSDLYFETNPGASITLLLGMEQTLLGEVVSWERAQLAHEEGDSNDTR